MHSRTSTMFIFLLLTGLSTGCAHNDPRREDMGVTEHNAEAERLRDEAMRTEESAAHEPSVSVRHAEQTEIREEEVAAALRRHAAEHDAAARELQFFEAQECTGIPDSVRGGCPLLRVERVIDTQDGVVLKLKPGTDVKRTIDLVRCYFAFARTQGFPTEDECPFNLRDVYAIPLEGEEGVRLITERPEIRRALQQRIHAIFPHPAS